MSLVISIFLQRGHDFFFVIVLVRPVRSNENQLDFGTCHLLSNCVVTFIYSNEEVEDAALSECGITVSFVLNEE